MSRWFRILAALMAIGLVAAACDDSDDNASEAPVEETEDGAAGEAGDGDEGTPAEDAADDDDVADVDATAEAAAGTYTGEWTNDTFGSTGSLDMTVEVDTEARTISMSLDLGGPVFGEGPREAVPFEGTYDETGATLEGTNELYGDYSGTIDLDGNVTLEAPDVPADRIASQTITGTITDGTADLEFTVGFPDGSEATGTATLERV